MRDSAAIVARFASAQHGRITVAQLRAAGVDKRRTYRWVREGRLHRLHREVYAVGHLAHSVDGHDMGAVLASGAGAVLSHAPCHEAWVRHDMTPHDVEACIARNAHKPGIAKLRAALGADVTLSELERGFLALLQAHDLPLPRTNIDHHGDKVDCHWPQLGFTIELLSFRFHATRYAFEQDVARRRRSNHVASTWGDVFERPADTLADLAPRLA